MQRGPAGAASSAAAGAAAAADGERQQTAAAINNEDVPQPWSLRLHQAVGIVGSSSQLAVTVAGWSTAHSDRARAYTALLSATTIICAAAMVRWPAVYWRHRLWVMSSVRIALQFVPTFRQVHVGASLLLDRAPQPGLLGALLDLMRALLGSRLLGLAVGGLAVPMPPALTLGTQLTLLLLLVNNSQYCSTWLLADPVQQVRCAHLAAALDYASLPALVLLNVVSRPFPVGGPALLRGTATASDLCCAMLLFLQLSLGVLMPTLVSVCCWPSEPMVPAPVDGTAASPSWDPSSLPAVAERLLRRVQEATQVVDRALHGVLCSPAGWVSRVLVSWWCVSVLWWFSKKVVGFV